MFLRYAICSALCFAAFGASIFFMDFGAPNTDLTNWLLLLVTWIGGAGWVAFGLVACEEHDCNKRARAHHRADIERLHMAWSGGGME